MLFFQGTFPPLIAEHFEWVSTSDVPVAVFQPIACRRHTAECRNHTPLCACFWGGGLGGYSGVFLSQHFRSVFFVHQKCVFSFYTAMGFQQENKGSVCTGLSLCQHLSGFGGIFGVYLCAACFVISFWRSGPKLGTRQIPTIPDKSRQMALKYPSMYPSTPILRRYSEPHSPPPARTGACQWSCWRAATRSWTACTRRWQTPPAPRAETGRCRPVLAPDYGGGGRARAMGDFAAVNVSHVRMAKCCGENDNNNNNNNSAVQFNSVQFCSVSTV